MRALFIGSCPNFLFTEQSIWGIDRYCVSVQRTQFQTVLLFAINNDTIVLCHANKVLEPFIVSIAKLVVQISDRGSGLRVLPVDGKFESLLKL